MRMPLLATLALVFTLTLAACDGVARGGREPGEETALPRMAQDYPIRPVPFTRVHVNDAFWAPRLETNRTVTIPYAFKKCEETGRISNFAVAGGLEEGTFEGTYFNDSDVYKVLEGAAYALANHRDPELEAYVDGLIAKIAAAQEDDGYLYTSRTILNPKNMPPGGKERWSNIPAGHELYCVGHLYEAAVAHYQATGKRTLLDVALASADLICAIFGPDELHDPPGHQEIEVGLAKLYRVTGKRKYLDLAKFFLDMRGRKDRRDHLYGPYSQDHKPVVEQTEAVGHAVRAAYMYAGMADVAALTGDASYTEAIGRIWNDVVGTKLYVTGGIGARGGGEGFGEAYELPNSAAYCETCASIANVLWNHRLFLIHGDARYLDVLERTLYNAFLGGVSMEGNRFFYPNVLESFHGERRAEWFGCACCPSNVCRFVPSVPGYVYAHRNGDVYVNLFIAGTAEVPTTDGTVRLTQETRYPWDGTVRMTVEPDRPGRFALLVRIPGWARNRPVPSDLYHYADASDAEPTLSVNGKAVDPEMAKGFARLERRWKTGDTVTLTLPMPVRRVLAHEKVLDDAGRVALERGPIVFCGEGIDHAAGRVLPLVLPDGAPLSAAFREDLLGGVTVVRGTARAAERQKNGSARLGEERALEFVPYYARAHREPSQMTVWPARRPDAARPLPYPTLTRRSKVTTSAGRNPAPAIDQLVPRSSIDHGVPFLHWWPRKGEKEWVEFAFPEPAAVRGVEVYWFDDTGRGECRLPASWTVQVKTGGAWREPAGAEGFGCEKDRFNRTTFDPVTAEGLRIEIQGPEKFAVGIHEARLIPAEGETK
jgi:DUF1680 family protein